MVVGELSCYRYDHVTASDGLTLAAGATAYSVQAVCAGVQLPEWNSAKILVKPDMCLSAVPHVVSYAHRRPLI